MDPGKFGNNPFFNNPTSPANLLKPGLERTVSTTPPPTPVSFSAEDLKWIIPLIVATVCLIGAGVYTCYRHRKNRETFRGSKRNQYKDESSGDSGGKIEMDDVYNSEGTIRDDPSTPKSPTNETIAQIHNENSRSPDLEDGNGRLSEEMEPEPNENDQLRTKSDENAKKTKNDL